MSRNILFLCHRLPYPPNKGDKIRSYALLKHLVSRGTVHLACFVDDRADLVHLDAVRAMVGGECYFEFLGPLTKAVRGVRALAQNEAITVGSFRSARLESFLERLLHKTRFDDVVVFGSAVAPYFFKAKCRPERVLFDMVDVDSDKWQQYSDGSVGLRKWLYHREGSTLLKIERLGTRLFGKTILVSEFEAETFRKMAPESANKIDSITNGVDLTYFAPGNFASPFSGEEHPIVMTGHMGYRPNYEGALWFLKDIFPLVQRAIPTARAYFVGASPPLELRAAAGAHIAVTGRVADVRPYLNFASAVIAPLRIARGVQNKVLEAMAMAKPVVATQEATRGLTGVKSGVHLWVANEPRPFSEAVISALKGDERETVAQAAQDHVLKNHDWASLLRRLDEDLEKVNPRHQPHPREPNLTYVAAK